MGLFTFTYEVLNEKLNFFAVSHTRAQMENDQGSTIRVRRVHAYTGANNTSMRTWSLIRFFLSV